MLLHTPPDYTDAKGRTWKPYLVSYQSDGACGEEADFSVTIYAVSPEHAALVVQDLRHSATLSGQLVGLLA